MKSNATLQAERLPSTELLTLFENVSWEKTPLGHRDTWSPALHFALQALLTQPSPAFILWGPELTQMYNDGYALIDRSRHPRQLGKSVYENWPETREQMEPIYDRVLGGDSVRIDGNTLQFSGKDSNEGLVFSCALSPLSDEKGRVLGIWGVLSESPTKLQAQRDSARLFESDQRVRIALRAAKLGDWEWDPKTDRVILSSRATEIFGAAGGLVKTRADLLARVHPEDHERARRAVDSAFAQREDYAVEYRYTRGSEEIWLLGHGHGIYDVDGELIRMIGVVQDITARKLAEEEREILLSRERAGRAEAEHASQMKDEFLATLSHELRTPLNAIVGWSQLLLRKPHLPTDVSDGIATIERNGRAQAQLIEDLLDMSRIVSGKLIPNMERLDLIGLVKLAVETVRPSADSKGIELQTRMPQEIVDVKADPNRMQQVIWNLLTNALKFTQRGGSIEVSARRSGDQVFVSVTDTGVGIPQAFLPYIFDRFRQADASTTRRYGGLGLGLSLVKQLVELHAGSVSVESAGEGKGACFTISLPVYSQQVTLKKNVMLESSATLGQWNADEQADVARRLRNLKVLVVDDEYDSRMLVKRVLEEYQARVQTAASAQEAIEKLSQADFDVLVSDIGMPAEDGYSLMTRIRKLDSNARNTPAIALTAYARPEDRVRAVRSGFQMHIVKPVASIELLTVVAALSPQVAV